MDNIPVDHNLSQAVRGKHSSFYLDTQSQQYLNHIVPNPPNPTLSQQKHVPNVLYKTIINTETKKINYQGWSKHIIPEFNTPNKNVNVQRWNWIYLMADDWLFEWKVDEFIKDRQYIEVGIINTTTMQRIVDRTFDYNRGSEIVFNDQYLEDIKHTYADTNIRMRINNNLGNHVLKLKSKQMQVNLMFQYNITDNNNMVQLSKLSDSHYQVSVKKFQATVKGYINNITITNQSAVFPIFHIQRAVMPHRIAWYWSVANGFIRINNRLKKFTINLGYGKEQTDHIIATEDSVFIDRFIFKLSQSWRSSTSKSRSIRFHSQQYLQDGDFKFKFRKLKKETRNLGYLDFKNKIVRWYGEFDGAFIHKGKEVRFNKIKGISEIYRAEW